MKRRELLRGGLGLAGMGVFGCLDGLERESAWRNPPLVENRPLGKVYIPASIDDMKMVGVKEVGPFNVMLSYTFPHRFWLVYGDVMSTVEVLPEDSFHLMVATWDRESGMYIPTDVTLKVYRDGEVVDTRGTWPMISQTMGLHHGDNFQLPEEGEYTAEVSIEGSEARLLDGLTEELDAQYDVEFDLVYDLDELNDLSFELVDEGDVGTEGALGYIEMEDRPPTLATGIEELPGEKIGVKRSGDAVFPLMYIDSGYGFDGEYLYVSPRTPYNGYMLPFTSLDIGLKSGVEVLLEGRFVESVHSELGHHYGYELGDEAPSIGDVDEVVVDVVTPPQLSRHVGYETAFIDMESMSFGVNLGS